MCVLVAQNSDLYLIIGTTTIGNRVSLLDKLHDDQVKSGTWGLGRTYERASLNTRRLGSVDGNETG